MFLVCVYLLVVVVFCVCFFHAVDVLERALTQRTKPRCFFISSEEPDTKSTTSVGSKGADTRTVSAVWFRTTVRTSSVSNGLRVSIYSQTAKTAQSIGFNLSILNKRK